MKHIHFPQIVEKNRYTLSVLLHHLIKRRSFGLLLLHNYQIILINHVFLLTDGVGKPTSSKHIHFPLNCEEMEDRFGYVLNKLRLV